MELQITKFSYFNTTVIKNSHYLWSLKKQAVKAKYCKINKTFAKVIKVTISSLEAKEL